MSRTSVVPSYVRPPRTRVLGVPSAGWTGALVALLIGGIEIYARSGAVSTLDLVPVSDMVRSAGNLLTGGSFIRTDLLPTLTAVVLSFGCSAVIGVSVGWAMVHFAWCRAAFQPYLNVFYAVPTFALYPILVVLFGTGMVPIVILSTTFSVVVVISHAVVGFDGTPQIVAKLGTSLNLSPAQRFRLILLPAAVPDILAGLKLGLAYAIICVLASEFIISTHGLGRTVANAYNSFDTSTMYAGILFVVAFALLANLALGAVLSRFDWRRR
jgi:NitT/TauT family transport system permease protein